MSSPSPTPSRHPAQPPLDAARIAVTALALIDDHGLDALSMRRLGAELGVQGMALYRHFVNKDEILDAVRHLLVEEFAERLADAPPRDGWREHLHTFAVCYRQVALTHPNAFPLLATGAEKAWSHGREVAGAVLGHLLAAGFDEQTAIGAERTAIRYVIGYSLIETATAGTARPTPEVIQVERADDPLARLVRSITLAPDERLFLLGLDLILDGLATRLPSH